MQVADRMGDLDGLGADLVGGPDDGALLYTTTSHEHGHGIGVVATTEGIDAAAFVVVWRTAEFAGPNDERIIEHAAFFEVFDERGHRLIDRTDPRGVPSLEVIVAVPAAGKYLHEAHTLLNKPTGHQTLAAEFSRLLAIHAVRLTDVLRFAFHVDDARHLGLHAEGEFVATHARGEILVAGMLGGVALIEKGEFVEGRPLMIARLVGR